MFAFLLFFMFDSPMQMLLVAAVVFLFFGSSKLPQFAKSLGQTRKAFKDGMQEAEDEERMETASRQQLATDSVLPQVSAVSDEELMAEMRRRAEAQPL